MDDYCVNCKVFRNLNNKPEKVTVTGFSRHTIDEGYGWDDYGGGEVPIYSDIDVYRCEYCKTISFKESTEEE